MKTITIKYCQPCGFMPRALDLAKDVLQAYGMAYNKNLSLNLPPSSIGVHPSRLLS